MENRVFDANNGLWYTLCGDYYIPELASPEEKRQIGHWDRIHCNYLKEHRPILYNSRLLDGTLWTYLADLNEQAQDRLETIIAQMKDEEGITEALKASDQLAWVQAMNSIRNRAEEIIISEIVLGR